MAVCWKRNPRPEKLVQCSIDKAMKAIDDDDDDANFVLLSQNYSEFTIE